MPQPTFFIYDYETFGIHPAADRPALIRTVRGAGYIMREPQ